MRTHRTGSGTTGGSDDDGAAATPGKSSTSHSVQRKAVQRAGGGAPSDPASVVPVAESGIGAGSELPFRPQMESAFNTSFDDVKVHTGSAASSASAAIGAEAYTYGNDIVMGGAPTPSLVAHELAHVVQQRGGDGPSSGVGSAGDSFEREADAASSAVTSGGSVDLAQRYSPAGGAGAIQRKAVQRYESGEHAMIGSGMSYPFNISEMEMPNHAMATTGELVAFGDFYADMEQFRNSPRQETESLVGLCRFEAIWTLAEREKRAQELNNQSQSCGTGSATTDPSEAQRRPAGAAPSEHHLATASHVGWGDDEIWNAIPQGCSISLRARAQEIHTQFAPAWEFFGFSIAIGSKPNMNIGAMRSTLGRRRFRGENNSLGATGTNDPAHMGGDYFDLAGNNVSHFAVSNWATYQQMHEAMCAKVAADPTKLNEAKIEDGMGCHYLTDQFASGHMVDKQALMTYATDMMIRLAESNGRADPGADRHATLKDMLEEALQQCFDDDAVYAAWTQGCQEAHNQGLIDRGEMEMMTWIPRGNYIAQGDATVVGQIVSTIMSMPWRNQVDPNAPGGGDARSSGPAAEANGSGDYHMGVGNLAALQVHEAMNHIGFMATNGAGNTWHMQGDEHLTAETQGIAQSAVQESQRQVEAGVCDVDAVKQYTPSEATMIPDAFEDFFARPGGLEAGQGVHYDEGRLNTLRGTVAAASVTPFPLLGGNTVSTTMRDICNQMMEVLFNESPADPDHGDSGTGLNISMLRAFLIERLPTMVAAAYASTSATDLPPAALEAYVPRNAAGGVLPTAANNVRFEGDTVSFRLNVTNVEPGIIPLGIRVYDIDGDNDHAETGQELPGVRALRDDDERMSQFVHRVEVPAAGGATAGGGGREFIDVSYAITGWGTTLNRGYVMIYADSGCEMVIGRSNERGGGTTNVAPTGTPPRVTGADAMAPDYVRATGILSDAFVWDGPTVRFRARHNAPPTMPASTPVRVWYRAFNKDLGYDYNTEGHELEGMRNDDPEIGSIRSVQALRVGEGTEDIMVAPEDNENDTYIVVYADAAGTQSLGRSNTQGNNRGAMPGASPNAGVAATDVTLAWVGGMVMLTVQPRNATAVWLKFYDEDWGNDYDARGNLLGGSRNEDPQVGGIHRIAVTGGLGYITPSGDADNSGDTYAIAFADSGCSQPIGKSGVQP